MPPLTRLDTLRGLRISTAEGLVATIWAVLTTGAFQTGFALSLGASAFHLGLLAGLPAAVGLLQVPASIITARLEHRKQWVAFFSLVGRLFWLPILFLPWLVGKEHQPLVFLILLGISSACLTVTVPAWTSWMSDLVPSESRGRYFGHRNTLAGLATMLVPVPAGWLLDRFPSERDQFGFAILFGLACLFALGAFVLILRQPEPPSSHGSQSAELSSALVPFRDPVFRRFLAFACLLVAGQGIGGPFFLTWQLESDALALPYLGVQILGGVASGFSLLANSYWGYVTDKFGARPVLALACLVVAIAPILWVMTDPGKAWNIPFILLLSITSGIGWSAIGLAQFHLLIGLSRPEFRAGYVGFFSAATGIVGGVAPLIGGWLMESLSEFSTITGPVHWNNFKVVFLLSAILRLMAPWFLRGLSDSQEPASADMVRRVLDVRNVSAMRHVRRLAAPLGSEQRREAIAAIGENRSRLAVDELLHALQDVSPDVRLAAVRSLAEIGDSRCIPALGQCLTDPALGIGTECAEALARIAEKDAIPWLVKALDVPDGRLRIAAIRALGELGNPDVAPDLVRVMDPAHQTRTETACSALAKLSTAMAPEAIEPALPTLLRLLDGDVPRGVRLAAAMVWERLTEMPIAGLATPLTIRLDRENDPAVAARLASSVARFGYRRPHTLKALQSTVSRLSGEGMARTQALLALADWRLSPGTLYPWLGLDAAIRTEKMVKALRERATSPTLRSETARLGEMIESGDDAAVVAWIAQQTQDPVARFLSTLGIENPADTTFAVLIYLDTLDHPD